MIVNEYGRLYRAATKLQATYRARQGRQAALNVKMDYFRRWTARKMQAVWRGKQGRREAARRRSERARRRAASTTIASFGRMLCARNELERRRRAAYLERLGRAAVSVQSAWRVLQARREATLRRRKRDELRALQAIKSVELQRVYRGVLGRRAAVKKRKARDELWAKRKKAATRLQRQFRGHVARDKVLALRAYNADLARREYAAAVACQRRFRMWRCRNIVHESRVRKHALSVAATKVQSQWRARDARLETQVKASIVSQQREEDAAVVIQNMMRSHVARAEVHALRAAEDAQRARETASASKMQRVWRGHKARVRIRALKEQRKELLLKMVNLETWAATTIEAAWRGHGGRGRAAARAAERKARWKEMFDEESQRPFYYNQVSGEIRWRRPQDLLQLLRRPGCSNCEYYDAALECRDCGEFYCHGCWGQVHAGGRRRQHAFRALYDYYERRVDYGDGEFPSRWPTEVTQDEMTGWLLRIAPERQPAETKGAWQRFHDVATGRDFYYNRISGDGRYDPPDVFGGADARAGDGAARGHRAGALALIDDTTRGKVATATGGVAGASVGDGTLASLQAAGARGGKATASRGRALVPTSGGGGSSAALIAAGDEITWEHHVDEGGREYYVNRETGESSYSRPGVSGSLTVGDARHWSRHYDEQYQIDYYHNAFTGESTYQPPPGFIES